LPPALRVFDHARVIEIPTWRWTANDAVKFDLDLLIGTPLTTPQRPAQRRSGARPEVSSA
jgi:hypothetical protein